MIQEIGNPNADIHYKKYLGYDARMFDIIDLNTISIITKIILTLAQLHTQCTGYVQKSFDLRFVEFVSR